MIRRAYIRHAPDATAAADPPEEPPAERSSVLFFGLAGLVTGPKAECTLADLNRNQSDQEG